VAIKFPDILSFFAINIRIIEEQEAYDFVENVQMIIDAITSGDFEGWK
jgi:hypothetical protein